MMGALTLVFLLAGIVPTAQPPAEREYKSVYAMYVTSPPVIDGVLDEPVWREADRAYAFRDKEGALSRARTDVRFLRDNENLYIGALCYDHEIKFVHTRATPDDLSGFWQDDLLELHFDIQNRPSADASYAELAVNASGALRVGYVPTENPEKLCSVAVAMRSTGYVAEVSMPLRLVGIDQLNIGTTWGMSIRRARARGRPDGGEEIFWSNPHLPFDDPSYFSKLILGPTSELSVWRLNLTCEGMGQNNRASIGVRNGTGEERTAGFRVFPQGATPPAAATRSVRANRASVVQTSFDIPGREPVQTFTAQLCRGATWEVLFQASLPMAVPPPLELEFAAPRYGGLLFPGERLLRATVRLNAPAQDPRQFTLNSELISAATTEPFKLAERSVQPGTNGVVHPAKYIPTGPAELRVEIHADGVPYARQSMGLVKLTTQDAEALPAYIDRKSRLIVDGKPFFPVGWYGAGNLEHLDELADSPFNCVLDYGMNTKSPRDVQAYLDAAQAKGIKVIYCMNDVYPGATYRAKMGDWEGNEEIAQGVVTTWKNHPALIAWYVNDELPIAKVPDLKSYYEMFRQLDRGHPTLLVHCDRKALSPFRNTADILGVDCYPVPGDLEKVGRIVAAAESAVARRKPIWAVLQTFGWYQYRPAENPEDAGNRGRMPTTRELAIGRPPNRAEVRCMTYLALISGAKGILYYCYYDMRVLPEYDSMWEWMKEIGEELKFLSPLLLEGAQRPLFFRRQAEGVSGSSIALNDEAYILVANTARTEQAVNFRLPPGTWQDPETLFETYDGFEFMGMSIGDKIPPYGARMYKLVAAPAEPAENPSP